MAQKTVVLIWNNNDIFKYEYLHSLCGSCFVPKSSPSWCTLGCATGLGRSYSGIAFDTVWNAAWRTQPDSRALLTWLSVRPNGSEGGTLSEFGWIFVPLVCNRYFYGNHLPLSSIIVLSHLILFNYLVWFELIWFDLLWLEVVRFHVIWFDVIRFDSMLILLDFIWSDSTRCD